MNSQNFKMPSGKEIIVLELLVNKRDMYGLEMVKASAGLKRGTVYVLLGRMEDKGFIKSWQEKEVGVSGMPKRIYSITGLGQRILAAHQQAQIAFAANTGWEGAS